MGYKGVSVMDSGYFYCPYISLDDNDRPIDNAISPHPEEEIESTQPEEKVNWLEEGF